MIVKNRRRPLGYDAMSDYTIPEPEPKEIDERLSVELSHLVDNQVLRGHPSGDERCDNCRYYLEPYKDLSYCWHPKLRILVGGNWWCQWWEEIPEGEATGT
jgi:hypothetical protein